MSTTITTITTTDGLTTDNPRPASNNAPPSPTPPWARPVQSASTNSLFVDGSIDLRYDTTYLDSITPKDVNNLDTPYQITLPNGNYNRQVIRILLAGDNTQRVATAKFLVTGTGLGWGTLLFDSLGTSAMLHWTGSAWAVIGGNATPV